MPQSVVVVLLYLSLGLTGASWNIKAGAHHCVLRYCAPYACRGSCNLHPFCDGISVAHSTRQERMGVYPSTRVGHCPQPIQSLQIDHMCYCHLDRYRCNSPWQPCLLHGAVQACTHKFVSLRSEQTYKSLR
jgi:hypothetical protein